MTNTTSQRKPPMGLNWRLLGILALLGLAMVSIAACGEPEKVTPPPATIIRASDEIAPTATAPEIAPSLTASSLPMPPSRPAMPAQIKPTKSYPLPVSKPKHSPTPVVYPSGSPFAASKPKDSPTPVVYPTK